MPGGAVTLNFSIDDESPQFDFMLFQGAQLDEAKDQVRSLEVEIADLTDKISMYQNRVDNIPKRQEELLSITRDYDNTKSAYDTMLDRRLEAEISVNMEKKQKGEQFQVIDSARLPEKPISPNMKRLFLLTLISGLALGAGTVFILEYLNQSYRNPEDIENSLGLPVVATVPIILQPRQERRQRFINMASIASVIFSCLLLAAFAVVTLHGPDRTIEFIQKLV